MDLPVVIALALFGLLIGSFLNVVIARLPLDDPKLRSLGGRSRCPQCGAGIAWYDNIPLVSWLVLRARCRHCRARIPARYPLVEATTAVLWALVALTADSWRDLPPGLLLMTLLVPLTFIDIDHRILPNRITYPGVLLGLGVNTALFPDRWLEWLLASLGAGLFLLVTALVYPAGMGLGDVKLVTMMGAFLGAPVAIAMFAGFVLGLLPSLVLLARYGAKARKMAIPFGPFLAGGAVIGWFWGQQLLDAYLATLKG